MILFPRQSHGTKSIVVNVPDNMVGARVSLVRHHSKAPTGWTDTEDQVTWRLDEFVNDKWVFLGSSTTHGGLTSENGEEHTESWDETPLVHGSGRKLKITIRPHNRPIDTEVSLTWL